MWNGLLPIGSVVSLVGSDEKYMLVSSCIVTERDHKKIYDYAAVPFPVGFQDADNMVMFNRDGIENIFCVGYMTKESDEFAKQAEESIRGLRDGSISVDI